jgi:peptidoglycan/xylan/chitin deacetylase (PgdA/CDA1 family)
MRTPALALAAAMLIMTSCGQGANGNGAEIRTDGAGPAEVDEVTNPARTGAEDGTGGGPGTDGESETSAEPAEDSDAPGGQAEDAAGDAADDPPSAPLYRMNGAYRFVPIDEAAAPAKVVLLTFDDGPKDREVLGQMLDALDSRKAKAVFFVNGYRAEKQPELLELIHERGHMIGNHSWDHIDLKKQEEDVVRDQIGRVQRLVEETVGVAPKLFRPPFGSGGDYVRGIAEEFGLLYTTWSNGSLDWDSSAKNKPDAVIRNVLDQLHPGANILMHELPWTAEALDELLGKIEEEGYGFLDPALIETPESAPNGA